ncbi:hypothetical protein HK102_001832, partial [Quaeritorhiza haematococci]
MSIPPTPGHEVYEVIYRTNDIVGTFALNPLDRNSMALGTTKGIQEIDISVALQYFEGKGSYSQRQSSVDDLETIKASKEGLDGHGLTSSGVSSGPTVGSGGEKRNSLLKPTLSVAVATGSSMASAAAGSGGGGGFDVTGFARHLSYDSLQKALQVSLGGRGGKLKRLGSAMSDGDSGQ